MAKVFEPDPGGFLLFLTAVPKRYLSEKKSFYALQHAR